MRIGNIQKSWFCLLVIRGSGFADEIKYACSLFPRPRYFAALAHKQARGKKLILTLLPGKRDLKKVLYENTNVSFDPLNLQNAIYNKLPLKYICSLDWFTVKIQHTVYLSKDIYSLD